ncbi:MAG: hypothetical protein WA051_01135 [Minisyncoccia bacterium]
MKAIATIQKGRYTAHVLMGVAFAFVLIYILSTFSIVKNTAMRAQAQNEINKLSGSVGDLEFTYISMKNSLTNESIASVGLEPVSNIAYISRSAGISALAVRTQ